MKFATVRDLKNRTSEMLRLAARKDVLITRNGRPVALLRGMSEDDLEDYVLSHHPVLRASIEEARRDLRRRGGIPLEQVMRQLEEKLGKGARRERLRR